MCLDRSDSAWIQLKDSHLFSDKTFHIFSRRRYFQLNEHTTLALTLQDIKPARDDLRSDVVPYATPSTSVRAALKAARTAEYQRPAVWRLVGGIQSQEHVSQEDFRRYARSFGPANATSKQEQPFGGIPEHGQRGRNLRRRPSLENSVAVILFKLM